MPNITILVSDADMALITYLAAPAKTSAYLVDVFEKVVADQAKIGQAEKDRQAFATWKKANP